MTANSSTGRTRWARFLAWLGRAIPNLITLALAGIGAAAGFRHTHDWADHHGQHGWLAWADAVVIECMCLVAGFEIHRARQAGRGLALPGTVLVVGFLVQMTAQVSDAEHSPAGWLVAATPALGFLVVVKMVVRLPDPADAPADAPADDVPTEEPAKEPERGPGNPAPLAATSAAPAPERAPVVDDARPAPRSLTVPRVRLPQPLTDQITELVNRVRAEGREPTADDIRQAVKVPDQMATQILASLPPAPTGPVTPTNGHRVA